MTTFKHDVPAAIRAASTWQDDEAAFRAPDGRFWVYCGPEPGVTWKDETGQTVVVARWIDDGEKG